MESYTYDGAGNLLTANKAGTSHSYTYGNSNWRDLLTAYDGTAITYDAIGNPLSYRGWTFTWQNGRELATATGRFACVLFDRFSRMALPVGFQMRLI